MLILNRTVRALISWEYNSVEEPLWLSFGEQTDGHTDELSGGQIDAHT